jgi:hypothetical protein
MPRTSFVCVHKKTKLQKVIDDGWEDFLRENFPASSSSVQTKGQSAPVKQRRHIKPRQAKRPHLLINCLQEKHGRQIKAKGMTKQAVTATTSREDAFSHKTGLTRHPARPSTTFIGSTTPFTVASAGSSPTTEPVPCSQLTTDQQFAQILSLCETSMTDTRGLCTTLSNDRATQAQINMDLRNSIAKAHAAIDSLTSMLCKCPPKATTISIPHHPIAQGSFVNPISGISSITNSRVVGPEQHEDESAHNETSSDTDFMQILTLCQTSITETRGVRTELSNGRDTQARINTDLRTSLAKAHAAIDALTSQLRK